MNRKFGLVVRASEAAALVALTFASFPGGAAADDCLTAPGGAAPQGQHWYYRSDRATARKCWYLGDANKKLHQETAKKGQPGSPEPDSVARSAAPVTPAPTASRTGRKPATQMQPATPADSADVAPPEAADQALTPWQPSAQPAAAQDPAQEAPALNQTPSLDQTPAINQQPAMNAGAAAPEAPAADAATATPVQDAQPQEQASPAAAEMQQPAQDNPAPAPKVADFSTVTPGQILLVLAFAFGIIGFFLYVIAKIVVARRRELEDYEMIEQRVSARRAQQSAAMRYSPQYADDPNDPHLPAYADDRQQYAHSAQAYDEEQAYAGEDDATTRLRQILRALERRAAA